MSEWKEKILDELGYTYPGLSGKTKKDFGNGKPFVPFMNVMANGKIDPEFLGYVEVLENEHQNEIKTGDLFFTTSSETPEEVGMTSVLLNDIGECYLNSFCFGFRLYNYDDLIPDYAPYLFRGNEVRKQIINLGQGYTRFNLPKTELVKKLTLNLPTIPEQQKISEILTAIDNIIDKTQSAIAKYKVIKQGMLHDLFTRGIDIQTGKLRPRYQEAPELYKESKLGWIPKEWECEMLSSIIEIISGGTPSTQIKEYWDGEIPWLSVDDFNTGNRYPSKAAKKITEEGLKKSATNMLLPGMLIISARGTVGVIAQMKAPMAFNQSCYGLNTVNEYLSNDYLYYYLTFFIRFIGFKSYGSVFDVITRSSFDEVFIPINKKSDEQRMIVEKLTAIDTKLHSEQSYLEKMQQIKKGLMEDLLSGKRRVEV